MLLRRQKITEKGGVGVVGITADEIIELFKEKGLSSVIVLEEGGVFKELAEDPLIVGKPVGE